MNIITRLPLPPTHTCQVSEGESYNNVEPCSNLGEAEMTASSPLRTTTLHRKGGTLSLGSGLSMPRPPLHGGSSVHSDSTS
ncbi:hypothetical protein TNCV_2965911 [Trichonephila clavipes]|nr:hypothetical protein TNCV_2965911 [Trichonephila clavipes]